MPTKFYLFFLCPLLRGAVLVILLVLQCGFLATASGEPAKEQAGKLPAIRLGAGSVRYRKSDVERFVTESITPKAQA